MRIKPWGIGLFLLVGFGFFTAILFLIGSQQKAFSKHFTVYAEFANVGGLIEGAKVRVSGLDAGEIKKIELPARPSGRFRLKLQLEDKVQSLLRRDSMVSIETEGVVGDKFILIKKGSDEAEEVRAGSTLPSKEPFDLTALIDKGSGILDDVQGTIKDVRGRADTAIDSITKTVNHTDNLVVGVRPDMQDILSHGRDVSRRVDVLVTGLNAGKGAAGMLLRDDSTKQQLQDTLVNVKEASLNLDHVSARADETMADFQSRDLIAKTQATIDNVRAISQQLNATVKTALSEDSMGEDAGSNLRQTLTSLNRSTTNLAEDTEALKHEFFFRSFFKKRGFYSLDQITPDEYRAACERQKKPGKREWLRASPLLELGVEPNNNEGLSLAGREQLDSKLAPVLQSLPGQLIMVEGYSTAGTESDQYVLSRRRANLVRNYLETHYHLRHEDIGIVALENRPPSSSGQSKWDGVAVMVLKDVSNE